ncbi:YbaN family protein [Blastochloris viridis]|uniref:Inner membrane protein ybaN n=1 Tax=Blastochloris viridis TaxID=1079 RepID=A0A0H5BF46_BLAVI|nr:YbaN family protein [Blastochloris viridis]ALK09289.1 Inner membrane protein YbaN [Blastochloris viridis]BAS00838.1 hypothetical protein BV133_3244 [Blastochloris viridis]CUU41952.1 Inner membrane protein ybaN [Blastochloris viridis]
MTPPAPEPPDEPPVRTTSLGLRRYVYRPLGFVALGLGIVGVVTPVMPGTVFLILAAWLFARSSPEVERWILTHPRYGPLVRDWRAHGVIPRKVKLIAFASFGVSLAVEWAVGAPPIAIGSTAVALLAVGTWMATRPETPR